MSRKHYSPEFREQIVALASSGKCLSSLAREFEPSVQVRGHFTREGGAQEVNPFGVTRG